MKKRLYALLMMAALVPPAAPADAQQDRRVADLVSAGKIRVGLHLPQFIKDPATGEIHGTGRGSARGGARWRSGSGSRWSWSGIPPRPRWWNASRRKRATRAFSAT